MLDNDYSTPLGYEEQKVEVYIEGKPIKQTWVVPERALIKLPTGQMPNTLVGTIQMDVKGNLLDAAINDDGTFSAKRFEGLKKSGKVQAKEKQNRVLLVLQKVSENDDSLPLRSVRVMQAQQGTAGGDTKTGKRPDVVLKVWDSLDNKYKLVKRDEGSARASVMNGYMVVGKITVDNDLNKYFLEIRPNEAGVER